MFSKTKDSLSNTQESGFVYVPPSSAQMETREIEKAAARLFASDDGRRVLSYLQTVTFNRALGPAAPDEQLRYMEGQRALVAAILRLIDRGRR